MFYLSLSYCPEKMSTIPSYIAFFESIYVMKFSKQKKATILSIFNDKSSMLFVSSLQYLMIYQDIIQESLTMMGWKVLRLILGHFGFDLYFSYLVLLTFKIQIDIFSYVYICADRRRICQTD